MEEKYTKPNGSEGFQVPSDFFEQQKHQLLHKINQGGFSVPKSFFEDQKNLILSRIDAPKKLKVYYNKPIIWIGIAATLFCSGLVGYYVISSPQKQSLQLTNQQIENYLIDTDIDIEIIAQTVSIEDNDLQHILLENINQDDLLIEL